MSITAGIAATKATLEVAKLLMDRLNTSEVDVHDVRLKVQEMLIHVVNAQIALGDAQAALHEAEDINRKLKRDNEALKANEAVTASLVFADDVYLRRKPDGTFDGPFCPACWDIDAKVVRLKLDGEDKYTNCPDDTPCRKYDCIVHKISYYIKASKFNNVNVT
jgi:hypothetical protein